MHVSRRHFLGSASAMGAVSFFPNRAFAVDSVRIGVLGIDMSLQPFYAKKLGLFDRAGITVEVMPFQSGSAAAAALIGGSLDVSFTDTITIVSAHAKGVPLSYIAPGSVHTPTNPPAQILLTKSSPIAAAKDLNGKTVAVNGIKNILQIPTEGWIDNNGGDAKSVRFIELPFPAMAPALLKGEIDAAVQVEPLTTIALNTGDFRIILPVDNAIAPSYALGGWAVRNDWAASNSAIVKKLVDIFAESARWGNANHAASVEVLEDQARIPPAVAAKVRRCTYSERLTVGLFQPVIDATAKYGVIATTFPAHEIFNPSALRS